MNEALNFVMHGSTRGLKLPSLSLSLSGSMSPGGLQRNLICQLCLLDGFMGRGNAWAGVIVARL